MAAPLILRIITDATQTLRATSAVSSSYTRVGVAALKAGENINVAAKTAVLNSVKVEEAIAQEAAAYGRLAKSAELTGVQQAKAAQLAEIANAKLARSQGLVVASTRGVSSGARTAENDLGKLTRGALAGSGVISSLGRSLAFASGGFIAVAGTATLLHNAITEALTFAATEKQVTAQLKTSGLSFEEYKTHILDTLTAQSKLSAFTRGDLLQSFGYLVRVSGNVDQSLKLTAVAADVARGRHIALSSASIALAKALGGSSTALRRLGIIVPKTAVGMAAIEFVAKKFAGQAEAGATSSDHLKASLTNAGEVIGTRLLPTFNRLATEFSDWISKMDASGKLQKDVNEGVTLLGYAFHTVGGIIKAVDKVTGGFVHTLEILIALELGSKIYSWGKALNILAGAWFRVGTAATEAGVAQSAALAETGAAGGAAGAAGGAAGTGLIGGLLASRFAGRFRTPITAGETGARFAVGSSGVATDLAAGEVGLAAGVSATGVGALAVAAALATKGLGDLAKALNDAAGGGSTGDSIIGGVEGVLTGGLVGDSRFGILPELLNRNSPFRRLISPPPPPPPAAYRVNNTTAPFLQLPGTLGAAVSRPTAAGSMFGGAQPMQQYWKQWEEGFKLQNAQLQAALTKSNKDDIAVAKGIIAKIKKQLDEGVLHGPAYEQALQALASALGIVWQAATDAAQKAAAKAAAAKQKIITEIQNAIDPIDLQIALARTEASGGNTVPVLKKQLAAAYNGLAKAIANGNKQLILSAYQQIKSIKDAIKTAVSTATSTFTIPAKLALDIARDQALGKGITDDLKEERRALYKWIASHRKNIQGVTDAYNQITAINSQLNSDVVNAYGDYKKASVKALTQNLGLTPDQRRRLEQRLSQRGPGGTTPESGTGAAGYVIDPTTGRPVRRGHHSRNRRLQGAGGTGSSTPTINNVIDLTVNINGKQVEAEVTKQQQRRRRHNPTQTRGPNAATSVA